MRRLEKIILSLSKEALENGEASQNGKVEMFCVGISKKETLIGKNKYIVSKQVKYNYPKFSALHAELDYFHKAKKLNFEADDIVVFGVRKTLLKNTKPCIYCASLLAEVSFKRIHFFEDGKLISLTKKDFLKRTGRKCK